MTWNPLYDYWRLYGRWGHDLDPVMTTRQAAEDEDRVLCHEPSERPVTAYDLRRKERRSIRRAAVDRWSWAVPSPAVLELIADHGPIIEIGAGTGYWARLLTDMGVDIIATDVDPPPVRRKHVPFPADQAARDAQCAARLGTRSRGSGYHPTGTRWAPVGSFRSTTAARLWSHRTLLLIWPPPGDSHAAEAVAAYLAAGGRRIIYIGEGPHGVTGDDRLHALLGLDPSCLACLFDDPEPRSTTLEWEDLTLPYQHVCRDTRCRVVDTARVPQWADMTDQLWICEPIEASHDVLRSEPEGRST